MTTSDNSLPIGYVLHGEHSQYTIQKKLGQGAFGITYMAETEVTLHGNMGAGVVSALVAIKEFFMKELNSRDDATSVVNDLTGNSLVSKYRNSFLREANHMASLSRQNPRHIVQVIEVFEANNTAYIVMQYVKGGNVDNYIQQHGPMSEKEAIPMFRQICEAVGFMHDNKMLHLDLKPKNIMLREDGQIQIIDFGLSKQYNTSGEAETSTTIGLGTPGYAASEQIERRPEGTFPVTLDIYALGATLYKMLTGQTPPQASAVLNDDTLLPGNLKQAGVSDSVAAVIIKAMMPASRKRYQSTKELLNALADEQTYTVGSPARKKTEETNVVNVTASPKKEKRPFTVQILVIIASVILGAGLFYLFSRTDAPTPRPTTEPNATQVDTLVKETDVKKEDIKTPSTKADSTNTDKKNIQIVSSKTGTYDLGYGIWEGELKAGKPHGEGRITYKQSYSIGDEAHTTVQSGDVVEGQFENGHWINFPRWRSNSSGEVKTLSM